MKHYQLLFFSVILFFLLHPHCVTSSSSSFLNNNNNNNANSSLMLQFMCHHDQSLALLQFKNAFTLNRSASEQYLLYYRDTVTYPKTLSWKENTDCCTWDGVTCDVVTGHVIALKLSCSWLQGTIHSNSTLFRLRHLQRLYLRGNDFCGSQISSQFGGFANLTHLDLSISRFSGLIPSEIFHLSKLVLLDLSSQYVNRRNTSSKLIISNTHSFEKLVQNLTHLQKLSIGDVDMSSVEIDSLRNLSSSLKVLILWNCGLRGKFPDYIFHLPNLEVLSLAGNSDLTVYFPKFNSSSPLDFLDLSFLNLYGSISAFGNLTQLDVLRLISNNLSGVIPSSFSKLQQLRLLELSNNRFTGTIPSWLGNLTQIHILDLSNNNFGGLIPSSVFKLKHLRYLSLAFNNFSGHFPSSSPGVEQQLPWEFLCHFNLQSNMLEGLVPVPPLSTTYLVISNNKFTGEIHSLICKENNLEILNLSNNSLSGTIPQCLGNFSKNLTVLDLRMNNFSGNIPNTFERGNALRTLNLDHNKLEGPVPQSLLNCTNLEVIDLGNNKIKDTFPNWLDSLPELQILALKSNIFHGPIRDSSMTKHPFPKLRILDLSDNDFNGPLPTRYLQNLIAMMNATEDKMGPPQYMFRDNNFHDLSISFVYNYYDSIVLIIKGVEITYKRILVTVTTIDLSSNLFQGDIPTSIGKLYSLRYLNFSHNNLTGHIPTPLENLKRLEQLDLSSNHLTGQIPWQLASLTYLVALKLSENSLEGPIPHGKQFDTFEADSYSGNLGLCGPPLSKKCSKPQTLPSEEEEEEDDGFISGFEWKIVLMGYGCGMVIGLSLGYLIFSTWTPKWLSRIVQGMQVYY